MTTRTTTALRNSVGLQNEAGLTASICAASDSVSGLKAVPLRSSPAKLLSGPCCRNSGNTELPHAMAATPRRQIKVRARKYGAAIRPLPTSFGIAIPVIVLMMVVGTATTVIAPQRHQIDFVENHTHQMLV